MALMSIRLLSNNNLFSLPTISRVYVEPSASIQVRNYAARKGTRERKQKKKVKVAEVQKVGFIPHNLREKEKMLAMRPKLKFDDSWKRDPVDNVYLQKYYKMKIYSFQDAIQCHRETHHPDMYNVPNANLHVGIELNMQGEKKTRFVDDFHRIVPIPHKFEHGEERSIIAFSKSVTAQQEALDAGAQLVGGADLIKQIQNGAVSLQNFQFVIAHPDILPDLVPLRGLMKRKFPNPKSGSLDVDLAAVTSKFVNGIQYSGKKDDYEKDFGFVETILGTLDMDPQHLEANFSALIRDIYTQKPRRSGIFIARCLLWSPPSREKLKVGYENYLEEDKKEKPKEEDEEVGERVAL